MYVSPTLVRLPNVPRAPRAPRTPRTAHHHRIVFVAAVLFFAGALLVLSSCADQGTQPNPGVATFQLVPR